VIGMMHDSAEHRRDHERQVVLLARIIEVRGGDDDDYAERFLRGRGQSGEAETQSHRREARGRCRRVAPGAPDISLLLPIGRSMTWVSFGISMFIP
jgi:hypothetical protein